MAGPRAIFLLSAACVLSLLSVIPIEALEAAPSKKAFRADTPEVRRYNRWLDKHGAQRTKLELVRLASSDQISDSDGGGEEEYGVVAPKGFKAMDVLATIPPQLWVTDTDLEHEFGVDWKGKGPHVLDLQYMLEEDGWEAPFALWLMKEKAKGDTSFYYPYLELLPKRIPVPLLYEEAELDEIQYEPMIKHTQELREQVQETKSRFETLGYITPSMSKACTYEWAVSIVWSTAFKVNVDATSIGGAWGKTESKEVFMLIPFLDMMKHSFDPEAEFVLTGGKLSAIGTKKTTPGAQIHLHYGQHSNDFVFAIYGTIPSENNFNDAFIFTTSEDIARWYARNLGRKKTEEGTTYTKAMALEAITNVFGALKEILPEEMENQAKESDNRSLFALGEDRFGPLIVAALAACSLNHAYLQVGTEQVSDEEYRFLAATSINMASPGNPTTCAEIQEEYRPLFRFALYTIYALSNQKLEKYPTSIKEDTQLLACTHGTTPQSSNAGSCPWDPPLSRNIQLAIKYRLGKKKLYNAAAMRALELCGEEWDVTDSSTSDANGQGSS